MNSNGIHVAVFFLKKDYRRHIIKYKNVNASRFSGTGPLQTDDPALEQARSLISNARSDVFKLQRSASLRSVKLVIVSGFSMILIIL